MRSASPVDGGLSESADVTKGLTADQRTPSAIAS
jgi:hypothetical protein